MGRLPRWFVVVTLLQFVGYGVLWFVLHVPNLVPPVYSGCTVPCTALFAWIMGQSFIHWLTMQPQLQAWLLPSCFALICSAYALTLLIIQRQALRLSLRMMCAGAVFLAIPLLLLPQLLSADMFVYAMFGRITLLYGGNPFVDVPASFPSDILLPFIKWTQITSIYGPVAILIKVILTAIAEFGGGSVGSYLMTYKLFALACHLINMWTIAELLRQLRPHAVTWGVLLYGWHPLLLVEVAGSGHNDVWMLTLMLLALLWAVQRHHTWALVFLVLAGMTKAVALLLVPLYALYVVRQTSHHRLWTLTRQALLGIAIVAGLYAPFWVGPQTFDTGTAAIPLTAPIYGPASWLIDKLEARSCPPPGSEQSGASLCRSRLVTVVSRASLGLFAVVYATLAFWPLQSLDALILRMIWVFVAYMLLAAIHFEPWYGTWAITLLPLLRRPRHLLWIMGCTMLVIYGTTPIKGRTLIAFAPLVVLVLTELSWWVHDGHRQRNRQVHEEISVC